MGYPGRYYKEALQNFAHKLYFDSDKKKAKEMLNEASVEKLENEIKVKRGDIQTKDFLFDAGMVAGILFKTANRDDGNDGFNACLGGLYQFEGFIKTLCN